MVSPLSHAVGARWHQVGSVSDQTMGNERARGERLRPTGGRRQAPDRGRPLREGSLPPRSRLDSRPRRRGYPSASRRESFFRGDTVGVSAGQRDSRPLRRHNTSPRRSITPEHRHSGD